MGTRKGEKQDQLDFEYKFHLTTKANLLNNQYYSLYISATFYAKFLIFFT